MTQIFDQDGQTIPVTVIQSEPCAIVQIKTKSKDGYDAIQLGFQDIKEGKLNKPLRERFKRLKLSPKKFIKEIRVANPKDYQVGKSIDLSQFQPGDFVDVVGTSIGRGFQGGIKRWNWSLGPKSHGSMSHRAPGSIGASASPSRVLKGHHLPGHMGNQRTTVKCLEVIKVDKDNNLLLVKGSVPGPKNSYLVIKKSRKKKKLGPAKSSDEKSSSS